MASRSIADLHPQARARAEKLLAQAKAAGLELVVTSTFRSFAEQDALYAQGRTKPGPRVTGARGGQSFHNVRRAFDVAFLRPDTGTLDWAWLSKSPDADRLWRRLGALAAELGLRWGGLWKRPDRPHFEDTHCAACGIDVGSSDAEHFAEDGRCRIHRRANDGSAA